MSSLIRRMTRNLSRTKYKGTLGMKVGQHNPLAADILARNQRAARRKERSKSLGANLEAALRGVKRDRLLHPEVPSNGYVDPKADRSL